MAWTEISVEFGVDGLKVINCKFYGPKVRGHLDLTWCQANVTHFSYLGNFGMSFVNPPYNVLPHPLILLPSLCYLFMTDIHCTVTSSHHDQTRHHKLWEGRGASDVPTASLGGQVPGCTTHPRQDVPRPIHPRHNRTRHSEKSERV